MTAHADYSRLLVAPPGIPSILGPMLGLAALSPLDRARRVRYESTLKALDVEGNPRYQAGRQGADDTYCNLFVSDATAMLGIPIPQYLDDETGRRRWLDANAVCDWLVQHPGQWRAVPAGEAQAQANRGIPVVAAWKNPGGIGHVALVRPGPEPPGAGGPRIAQAGRRNFNATDAATGFGGEARLKEIAYFAAVLGAP